MNVDDSTKFYWIILASFRSPQPYRSSYNIGTYWANGGLDATETANCLSACATRGICSTETKATGIQNRRKKKKGTKNKERRGMVGYSPIKARISLVDEWGERKRGREEEKIEGE